MDDSFKKAALDYHSTPVAGKLEIVPTKRMLNEHDLSLAYSPGVAAACQEIAGDPAAANRLTCRGNLVAVITNGTAVLGLGNIGPLAAKPVMEGKAVLFKKFAGIDVFDLELDVSDPDLLVDIVSALEPTFSGINLEDIKAPECFEIERRLQERMNIPVFHDDQHGTAIVCAAAVRNYLELTGKPAGSVRVVTSGAGAAAMACVNLLVAVGITPENVVLSDIQGIIGHNRLGDLPEHHRRYAEGKHAESLADALKGADIFLGLSVGEILKPDWLTGMQPSPLIMALANPVPEIMPEQVRAARPDAFIATGRSDYPNQVNNLLCFPFIFRGALDVNASKINQAMQLAAVDAIAALAHSPRSEGDMSVGQSFAKGLGPDYLIPGPFDPRLIQYVAPAVARAAMETGVARTPIHDLDQYRASLERYIRSSGKMMRPAFAAARKTRKRIVLADGTDDRTLRAAQILIDEGVAAPVLVGARSGIEARCADLGLRILDQGLEIHDPAEATELNTRLCAAYQALVGRSGSSPPIAQRAYLQDQNIPAAMLLREGLADGTLCGGPKDWWIQLLEILPVIPRCTTASRIYALTSIVLPKGPLFLCDTHMNVEPSKDEIIEMTLLAAQQIRELGITPKAAFLSHSNYGASRSISARKMKQAADELRQRSPDFPVDGEMHADVALIESRRDKIVHNSTLEGAANLLLFPSLDSAKIAAGLLSAAYDVGIVGPMLLGFSRPIHILPSHFTARDIVNLAVICASKASAAV